MSEVKQVELVAAVENLKRMAQEDVNLRILREFKRLHSK